jgi:hypothetical protein
MLLSRLCVCTPAHVLSVLRKILLSPNFMDLSPFPEANSFSGSQEVPNILWKLKVHYLLNNSPILLPILGWIQSTTTDYSYILILSSHLSLNLWSWLFTSGIPTKTLLCNFPIRGLL